MVRPTHASAFMGAVSCKESLARTTRELSELGREEWMDADEIAGHLRKSRKAFDHIVAQGEIPRHYYLTERGILFSRSELDAWLMGC